MFKKIIGLLFIILLLISKSLSAELMIDGKLKGTFGIVDATTINTTATLGTELITWTDAGWNEDGLTWTFAGGVLTHVTGNATTVTGTVTGALTVGRTVRIAITGTGGVATATYTLGGNTGTTIAASGAIAIVDFLTTTVDSELVITPSNTCTVALTLVSVKALTDVTGDLTVDGNLTVRSPATFLGGLNLNLLGTATVSPSGYVTIPGLSVRGSGTAPLTTGVYTDGGFLGTIGNPVRWNSYYSGGEKYIINGYTGFINVDSSGVMSFCLAPSGSAGGAITWTTPMTILNNGNVGLLNAAITAGSGTGITVNSAGNLNRQVYKVTTTYAAYTDTDTTKGIVIATLPAKTKLVGCYADTTTKYLGGTINAATLEVGITAEGAAEIIAAHDVFAAAILAGDADAEMGTGMTRAAAIQGGLLPSWTGTTAIYATIDTTAGNCNALTQGSTTFYLVTERY